jgi:hypothetical protein
MKRYFLSLAVFLFSFSVFAQTADKIFKHSGEVLEVKILKISDQSIIYKYPSQDLQENISKIAVDYIEYGNGVKEKVSDKVVINGKADWEKVKIIEDKDQVEGLKKGSEVVGKTSSFNWRSSDGSGNVALKRLKEEAAEAHAPFVLLTVDKDSPNNMSVGAKGLKKGIIYTYN